MLVRVPGIWFESLQFWLACTRAQHSDTVPQAVQVPMQMQNFGTKRRKVYRKHSTRDSACCTALGYQQSTAFHQCQSATARQPSSTLTKSLLLQGARNILGGIQNLQLASDVSPPTLLIRQQGKLTPPLLTSTIQHSNLSSSDLCLHSPGPHEAATATPATPVARSSTRFSHLGTPAFKAAPSPVASALMTGRLSKQSKPQGAVPSAPGGPAAAEVSTPQAGAVAARQDTPEAAVTPGTMTQEQWDALMQTGSTSPVSDSKAVGQTSKTKGRKKAVRPVLKKQRMNSIAPD